MRSAERASSQYVINASSEHAAITTVIESAARPSNNTATNPLDSELAVIWMLPAAAPTAPAISGKGCIVAFMMLGIAMQKASATAIKRGDEGQRSPAGHCHRKQRAGGGRPQFMSMPEYGTAERKPRSSEKVKEAG